MVLTRRRTAIKTDRGLSLPNARMIKLDAQLRWCVIDGIAFFLDLRRGEYFALDSRLTEKFASPGDWDHELIAALQQQGWLEASRTEGNCSLGRARSLATRPSALRCLLRSKLTLRFWGFAPAYGWAIQHAKAQTPAPAWYKTPHPIDNDLTAFKAAESFVTNRRGPKDCLPRSLALFVFLKSRGHAVRHVIGVKRYPFGAHAWVEMGGKPLLQSKSYGATPMATSNSAIELSEFVPIATIG